MIEWNAYKKGIQLEKYKEYLILSNEGYTWVAQLDNLGRWQMGFGRVENVTHYAPINLPGEEEA